MKRVCRRVAGGFPSVFAYVNLIRGLAADEKFKLFMAAISSVYRRDIPTAIAVS
ncbi:MAG: hypothetical protein ABSD63_03230 [Candidatus Korobacteraceae bacterium]|jgi:hypothetical protein